MRKIAPNDIRLAVEWFEKCSLDCVMSRDHVAGWLTSHFGADAVQLTMAGVDAAIREAADLWPDRIRYDGKFINKPDGLGITEQILARLEARGDRDIAAWVRGAWRVVVGQAGIAYGASPDGKSKGYYAGPVADLLYREKLTWAGTDRGMALVILGRQT